MQNQNHQQTIQSRLSIHIKKLIPASQTPLTLPFLLLRLNDYQPSILEPFRQIIEFKLKRLKIATSHLNIQSYLKDILNVLQQPSCPSWLNKLYDQLAPPIADTVSPALLFSKTQEPSNKRRKIDTSEMIPLSECSIWSKQVEQILLIPPSTI